MLSNTAKQFSDSKKERLLSAHHVVQDEKEAVVIIGEPAGNAAPKVPATCCDRCIRADGSVYSRCSFFSIIGYISYMSIVSCTSICAFACVNSAFSIASFNSVASVASVNSVLSIGSVNCYECVFNIPYQALSAKGETSDTCKKYSLVDRDEDHFQLLYGLTYGTFEPSVPHLSEDDLVNECCLFVHSSEAKKREMTGFILNAGRTGCLVFGAEKNGTNGEPTLDRTDMSMAKYMYTP